VLSGAITQDRLGDIAKSDEGEKPKSERVLLEELAPEPFATTISTDPD